MSFAPERSSALHDARRDAANTIARMPANYTGLPIFPITRSGAASRARALTLNAEYLADFGELSMPLHLWRALQR
jgi:hypothetical protein